MTEITYDDSESLIRWASEIIGFHPRTDVRAVGLKRNGQLVAVALWDGFSQCDCNLHLATDGSGHALTISFFRTMFLHPFMQWNMRRVTALIPADNERSLALARNTGFMDEGVIRKATPTGDIVILGLLRENCRFIPANLRSDPYAPE